MVLSYIAADVSNTVGRDVGSAYCTVLLSHRVFRCSRRKVTLSHEMTLEDLISGLRARPWAVLSAFLLLGLSLRFLVSSGQSLTFVRVDIRYSAQPPDGLPLPDQRLFGPPLRQVPLDNSTLDFEPEAYRHYYADVAGFSNAQLAAHYLELGRPQNRVRSLRHMPPFTTRRLWTQCETGVAASQARAWLLRNGGLRRCPGHHVHSLWPLEVLHAAWAPLHGPTQ